MPWHGARISRPWRSNLNPATNRSSARAEAARREAGRLEARRAATTAAPEVSLPDLLARLRRARRRAGRRRALFDLYAFADYRGGVADGPGVVLCAALGAGPARRVAGVRSRATLDAAWRRLLRDATDAGARVLFGQDHQYGIPLGLADELGIPARDWGRGLARLFTGAAGDAAREGRARDCARRLNAALAARGRPPYFWSATKPHGLPGRSPRGADPALRRLTERGLACPLARLGDPGSVGGQTLVGLPRLLALLEWAEACGVPAAAWPFDGFDLAAYPPAAHVAVEVYPSFVRPAGVPQSDLDDALAATRWAQAADRRGALARALDLRALPRRTRARVRFEGWIAGVPPTIT